MTKQENLLEALAKADPHGTAHKSLLRLLTDVQGSGAAILVESDKRPRIWLGVNVADPGSVLSRWDSSLKSLSASGIHVNDSRTLVLLKDGDEAVGVLMLEGAASFDVATHGVYLIALAKTISAATRVRQVGYTLEDIVGGEQHERAILIKILEDGEWNVARAARELGVTRRTVYERLNRWRIPRVKVPKAR